MFKIWRRDMGFTQKRAADALGYSVQRIKQFEAAVPAVPTLTCRLAMAALMAKTKPWPA